MKSFQIKQTILQILQNGPLKPYQIGEKLQLSKPTCNKYLTLLVNEGLISRHGSGAHIHYSTNQAPLKEERPQSLPLTSLFSYQEVNFLDTYFFKYASDGSLLEGGEGFVLRCQKRKLSPREKFIDFHKMINAIENHRNEY